MSMTNDEISDTLLADIFKQILESPRFQAFYELNYDMKKIVDDETKTVTYYVVEVPPDVVMERLAAKKKTISDDKPKIELITSTIDMIGLDKMPKFKA